MDARTRKRFEAMWSRGVPLREIASQLRYTEETLARLRMEFKLPPRGIGGRPPKDERVPSRAEILRRAAEVRASWSSSQYMTAKVGIGHTIYDTIQGYTHGE